MELNDLAREWRVWVLVGALLVSLVLLGPHYVGQPGTNGANVEVNADHTAVLTGLNADLSGSDGGQARNGGDSGTITLHSPEISTTGVQTTLEGGSGGPAGVFASAGNPGDPGNITRNSADPVISDVRLDSENQQIEASFQVSNTGDIEAEGVAFASVEDNTQVKYSDIGSGSGRTFNFTLEAEEGLQEATVGFNGQRETREIAVNTPRPELSFSESFQNESLELEVFLENTGSANLDDTLRVTAGSSEVLAESVQLNPGQNTSYSTSIGVDELSDSFEVAAEVGEQSFTDSICVPDTPCAQIQEYSIIQGDDPAFNITVQNTGSREFEGVIAATVNGSVVNETVELESAETKNVILDFTLPEGEHNYVLSTPQDQVSDTFVAGEQPKIEPEITGFESGQVEVTYSNSGEAEASETVTLRAGQNPVAGERISLDANSNVTREYEVQSDANSVTVCSEDYETSSVKRPEDPQQVSGEICGEISSESSILINDTVEVCGQGASITADQTIWTGENSDIQIAREEAGEETRLSLDASHVSLSGTLDGSAPAPGDGLSLATNINKGLDLEGGVRVLLSIGEPDNAQVAVNESSENSSQGFFSFIFGGSQNQEVGADRQLAQDTRIKLNNRLSAYGLSQATAKTVRLNDEWLVQIEAPNIEESRLRSILEQQGSFEARMPVPVADTFEYDLENSYTFERTAEGVQVANNTYTSGERFVLDGTEFVYINNTDDGVANIEAVAYSGEDVQGVQESRSRVQRAEGGYEFRFPVTLTTEAANNVQRVAQNYEPVPSPTGNDFYLGVNGEPALLGLYVDGRKMNALRMSSVFRTEPVTSPSISGGDPTAEEARESMENLQSILQSGSLNAPVEIETVSTVSSALGDRFWTASLISLGASLIAVGLLVYLRYGSLKVAVPIFFTGASEVFIITGSWFTTAATLDLASIAGIVAAVGTGVDDQIIIADESGREKVRSWRKRMKRAFFVIFTSAASTIGAMTPLVSPELTTLGIGLAGIGLIGYSRTRKGGRQYLALGTVAVGVAAFMQLLNPSSYALQSVRGFAITTILGVAVGITITRPAYAKILEYLRQD